jgi:hypothetical protein
MRALAMIRLRPVRTARHLVLALVVCLAQLGALVHAVSHLHELVRIGAPSTATVASNTDTTDVNEFCLECLAFAQVVSAIPGHPLFTPTSDSHPTAIALSGGLAGHSVTVVFLARAPPHLL